jgi:hypothetical protein
MGNFPLARRWQKLTPEMWNAARAFVRSLRLIQGPGIRLKQGPAGTIISADRGGPPWSHPFKVTLAGTGAAQIVPGFVNLIEPQIEEIPLSGTDKDAPPLLKWKTLKVDQEGRGYIALEVEANEKWELESGKASIVQVAFFDSENGEDPPPNVGGKSGAGGVPILEGRKARWPLALLRQRTGGNLDVYQVTHGDLQFRAQPRDITATTGRAFFW